MARLEEGKRKGARVYINAHPQGVSEELKRRSGAEDRIGQGQAQTGLGKSGDWKCPRRSVNCQKV